MSNNNNNNNGNEKKVLIVIGGGYGGIDLVQKLAVNKEFFVVLIDRKDHFFHILSSLRASNVQGWEEKPIIPYSSLFSRGNGQFIRGEVESILADSVKIHGIEQPLKYDYLVVATGSSYSFPNVVGSHKASEAIKAFKDMQERIAKALSIAIVGAGPVGIELAGEIHDAHGDTKKITIVHSAEKPLQMNHPDHFRDKVHKLLSSHKSVNLIYGEKVIISNEERGNHYYLDGRRTLTTDKGTTIETDLVFFTVGGRVNNASFANFFPLDEAGRIQVEKTLQVKGYSHIFALGDAAGADQKMAFAAKTQAPIVAQNIITLDKNSNQNNKNIKLKEYSPVGNKAIGLPFGSSDGLTRIGSFSLGNWVTGFLKGWDLGVPRTWKSFKLEMPNPEDNYHADFSLNFEKSDVELIAKHLKVTQETANALLRGADPSGQSALRGYS